MRIAVCEFIFNFADNGRRIAERFLILRMAEDGSRKQKKIADYGNSTRPGQDSSDRRLTFVDILHSSEVKMCVKV